MNRTLMAVCGTSFLAASVLGQPREWSDDFTAVATYNSDSLLAPCYGGLSTKYTTVEGMGGSIFSLWAASGSGRFRCSASTLDAGMGLGRFDMYIIGAVNLGQGCDDVVGIVRNQSTVPFTSPDICMYAGWEWNNWQFLAAERAGRHYGVDAQPGFANADDDQDGTTDEADEYPGLGPDGDPGVAGIDDDGMNGVDDEGEIGFPGSDDSDDEKGKVDWDPGLRLDLDNTAGIYLIYSPNEYSGSRNIWALREIVNGSEQQVETTNEIVSGFFDPYVIYSYVFCVSGTCYGAQFWTGTDMANPHETLGPVMNSNHTSPTATGVMFVMAAWQGGADHVKTPYKNYMYTGNRNFHDTYWVVSGNPQQYYPAPSPDLDKDKDVDGFDFLTFSNCYNGSNKPPLAACTSLHADLDKDGDVDGFDFLTFSNCYNGSNRRPLAACFPPNLTTCGS